MSLTSWQNHSFSKTGNQQVYWAKAKVIFCKYFIFIALTKDVFHRKAPEKDILVLNMFIFGLGKLR